MQANVFRARVVSCMSRPYHWRQYGKAYMRSALVEISIAYADCHADVIGSCELGPMLQARRSGKSTPFGFQRPTAQTTAMSSMARLAKKNY